MRRSSDFERTDHDRDGFERLGARILAYLRSRTADHWLMFVAGVVIGMILG